MVWTGGYLGPNDAVGFNTYPADRPAGPLFRRKFALRLRNFFVKFLVTTLELERRFPGFLIWTGQWRYDRQRRRAGKPLMNLDLFETHRSFMFGLAYRMLGTASEAEDVIQESLYQGPSGAAGAHPKAKELLWDHCDPALS